MAYIGVSPSNGVRKKHTYTATASQTSFSGAGDEGITLAYRDSNYVDVYQNGVKLADEDYTATSGTAIVLAQGASADDIVEIIAFDVFSVADTVSKADGGTFDGNVTMAGTLGVTGVLTGTSLDISGDIDVDGTTNLDVVDIDGAVNMATTALVTGVLTANGGAVFNEASADVDFRVESNGNANMLFVDGGNNKVGINDDVPVGLLSIKGGDSGVTAAQGHANELVIENNTNGGITFNCGASNSATLLFQNSTNADDGAITYRNSEREFRFKTAGAEQVRIHSNGVLSASDGIALGVGTANTASNVLDDYEEGTFTPTWDGYTPYATSGKYVKIGSQVTVYATLVTDVASDSSLIQINNLPFQISGNQGGGFVYHNSIPLYAFNIYTLFTSNSTICQLKTVSGGAEVGVKYLGSDPSMRGYSTMHWTIVYQTT